MKASVLVLFTCSVALSQSPEPAVRFTTASLKKLVGPGYLLGATGVEPAAGSRARRGMAPVLPPQSPDVAPFRIRGPLPVLLRRAFDLTPPQWNAHNPDDKVVYQIVATAPWGTSPEQVRIMLRNLLIERFDLRYRFERKPAGIYYLEKAAGGIKLAGTDHVASAPPAFLPPSDADSERGAPLTVSSLEGTVGLNVQSSQDLTWITARDVSLAQFLPFLRDELNCPVVDSTGLAGLYRFSLFYRQSTARSPLGSAILQHFGPSGMKPAKNLAEALEEGLGLSLVKKPGEIDVLVVDSFNRKPKLD